MKISRSMVEKILRERNQIKLLEQVSKLSDQEFTNFYQQFEQIPWLEYPLKSAPSQSGIQSQSFSPSKVLSLHNRLAIDKKLNNIGLEAYKNGEVAVLMVAGGHNSRLGFSSPKGCFKVGQISGKSLYQIHSEKVMATNLRFGHSIPFLIMTSAATDAETKEFFEANKFFSLLPESIEFFQQASIPSLDLEGNLLLADANELLTNPDGHGGCFTALAKSGLLNKLKNKGIKHLIYIQVDNALAPVYDPFLIGLAISDGVEVITKVVEKTKPEEKVGLLVSVATKVVDTDRQLVTVDEIDTIKEYIELPQEILEAREANGKLKYRFGNTAMHYWSVDFLERKYREGYKLQLHASKKPLKVWQEGQIKEIEGFKYERFIFDLIPETNNSLGLEVDRSQEFAPLKNSSGDDSPETVNQLCANLYRNWLAESGVLLSKETKLEVSPLFAMDSETCRQKLNFDKELKQQLISKSEKKESIYLD